MILCVLVTTLLVTAQAITTLPGPLPPVTKPAPTTLPGPLPPVTTPAPTPITTYNGEFYFNTIQIV